jgi:4-hydroxythreonine-4-phosphate dehydrogenase
MGDPTGIGPEVTLAALHRPAVRRAVSPILVGDPGVYRAAADRLGMGIELAAWAPPAPLPQRALPVRAVARLGAAQYRPGRPSAAGGRAAFAAIVEAVRLVCSGTAQALVTAPVCKANLAAAGRRVTGHTELLAELSGGQPVRMMMVGERLRVVLVTTHLALAQVPRALTADGLLQTLVIAARALREQFGFAHPRLGVAGLNPHAGEQGTFGQEEIRLIGPAIRKARRRGIDARGPLAADSLFPLALRGQFDALVCMYHDQGLAPFKLLHFADGVNVTIGLPFIRTSPDHGTAHDIAGRGVADPSSMAAALLLAAALARRGHRRRSTGTDDGRRATGDGSDPPPTPLRASRGAGLGGRRPSPVTRRPSSVTPNA